MSGVGTIADVHVSNHRRFGGGAVSGINRRARLVLGALQSAVDVARERRLSELVVCGDVFDSTRPEPQVIREVQRALSSLDGDGCEVVMLVGNHDQASTAPGDHALGPLVPCGTVVERPVVLRRRDTNLVCIPYLPGAASTWFEAAVKQAVGEHLAHSQAAQHNPRLLMLHLGIEDDDTPPWLRGSHDSVRIELLADVCDDYGIKAAFAGNWHDHKRYGAREGGSFDHIVQIGALAPTGFDNPGLDGYGTVTVWDNGNLDIVTVPGPRFVKVRTEDELNTLVSKLSPGMPERVFVSMVELPDRLTERQSQLAVLTATGLIEDFEVLPDDQVAKAQARSAATAAQHADTMAAAVERYVAEMPLDPPTVETLNALDGEPPDEAVLRQAVLARTKKYLRL